MIRVFSPADAASLCDIQRRSITTIGPRAYSAAQVAAWLSRAMTPQALLSRTEKGAAVLVAVTDGDEAAGYCLLEADGHLDHLYVDPSAERQGHAKAMLVAADDWAQNANVARLFTEACEIARPVFAKAGYEVLHRRDFILATTSSTNAQQFIITRWQKPSPDCSDELYFFDQVEFVARWHGDFHLFAQRFSDQRAA